VSKKYVSKDLSEQIHKKAEPFLNWLKEAEEESESEVMVFFLSSCKIVEIAFKGCISFVQRSRKSREIPWGLDNSKMSERYRW
jgi:hypothetical protein